MRAAIAITSYVVLGLFALGGLVGGLGTIERNAGDEIKSAVNLLMSAVGFAGLAIILTAQFPWRPGAGKAERPALPPVEKKE